MQASCSKSDVEEIPTDDPEAGLMEIQILADRPQKGLFKRLFRVLKKINIEAVPEKLVIDTLYKLVHLLEKQEQANELFRFAESMVAPTVLSKLFIESDFFADIWMLRLERNSDDVPFLVKQLRDTVKLEMPQRLLRKAMFRLCAVRNQVALCYKILKSISLSEKPDVSFLEFCGHATAIVPLIVNNEVIVRKLFNRIMDLACVLSGSKQVWMVKFAMSIAPLIRGKTIHEAVLDFVQFMERPAELVRQFGMATGSLYNKEMGFLNAPPFLRPYHLYKKWYLDPTKIAEMKSPVDVYNTILRFCKEDWERATEVLKVLPVDRAIVFYYLMVHSGHEEEFHQAIEKAFSDKQAQMQDFAIKMLEHCGRTLPGLVTRHLQSIEKAGLKRTAGIVADLIKADVVDFRKLWKHVQKQKFEFVKCVIRAGITQVQRRSKSIENTNFIFAVLNHYFQDARGSINWSRVAHEFHDDVSIVQTILLHETATDNNSAVRQRMMRWRMWFMGYVDRSRAEVYRALALPYLLLVSGEQNLPVEKVKWAVSYLPTGRTLCECIIEAFAVFELTRHVLAQAEGSASMEMLKALFGFDLSSASTYSSIFVHAGVASSARSTTSLNLLLDIARSKNGLYTQAANVALNILRLHSDMCNFDELKGFQKNELVDVVLSFLTPTVRNVPTVSVSESEQKILDILQSTRLFIDQDLDSELKHHVFNKYEQLHNHMLKLAVACFQLLPSRSVPQSSLDKCMSLLDSRSSLEEKTFAIRALAQVPVVPEFDFMSLVSVPELHNALLSYANGQNRMDLVEAVLEKSNDYLALKAIKPLLAFINGEIIDKFIRKTAPATDTEVLFSTLDIFANKQQLLLVFSQIRQRNLLPIFVAKQHQQLMTALAKFTTTDFSQSIAKPFDDFALLCVLCRKWEGRKRSSLCSNLTEPSATVTLPCLFQYALANADGLKDTLSSFLALAEAQQQTDRRILCYIATFQLVVANSEPFLTISHHFQTNPEDITSDLMEALAPALFAASEAMASQFKYMNRADVLQKEIIDCLTMTRK